MAAYLIHYPFYFTHCSLNLLKFQFHFIMLIFHHLYMQTISLLHFPFYYIQLYLNLFILKLPSINQLIFSKQKLVNLNFQFKNLTSFDLFETKHLHLLIIVLIVNFIIPFMIIFNLSMSICYQDHVFDY